MGIKKAIFNVLVAIAVLNFSLVNLAIANNSSSSSESRTSTHKFEPEKVYTDQNMINSVTMMAVGMVAKSLLKCQIKTADTMIAGAGGVAYLAGEVYAFFGYKEIEDKILMYTRDADNNIIDSDKKALEAQRKNYKELLKVIETKQMLQYAAAAGFTAAAVLAYVDAWKLKQAAAECKTTLAAAQKKCAAQAATVVIDTEAKKCMAELPKTVTDEKLVAALVFNEGNEPSTAQYAKVEMTTDQFINSFGLACSGAVCAQPANVACGKYVAEIKRTMNKCDQNSLDDFTLLEELNNRFDPLTLFFAEAYANKMMRLLGIGGVGYSVYSGIKGGHSTFIDRMIAKPMYRGIAFTAMAGLAFMAAKSLDEIIKQLKSNIEKIDAILKPMYAESSGQLYENDIKTDPLQYDFIDLDTGKKVGIPAEPVSEEFKAAEKNLPEDFGKLPNIDTGVAYTSGQLMTETSDQIAGKSRLSGGSLKNAKTLAARRAALDNNLRDIRNMYGDKTGEGNLDDLKLREKSAVGALKKATYDAFQKAGLSQEAAQKLFNTTPLIPKAKTKAESKAVKLKKSKGEDANFDMYFSTTGDPKKPVKKDEEIDSAVELGKYRDTTADINKSKKSIWDILSFRYFKSAYPVFADE